MKKKRVVKVKGRRPSNKSKVSKVRKLMRLLRSKVKRRKR